MRVSEITVQNGQAPATGAVQAARTGVSCELGQCDRYNDGVPAAKREECPVGPHRGLPSRGG
jgi:hypothetical protein